MCHRYLCHVTGNTRIRGWSALDQTAILLIDNCYNIRLVDKVEESVRR